MMPASSTCTNTLPDAYLGLSQTSVMVPLTIFAKSFIADVLQGPKYAYET